MQIQFPTFTAGYLALALCIAISWGGCTSRDDVQPSAIPAFPDGMSLNIDPDALPEDWTSSKLSVNHSASGNSLDILMRGERTKLLAAIDGIRDRLSTTVTVDPDIDENAELEKLKIDAKTGWWDDLPKKIAEDYRYAVSTRDGETRNYSSQKVIDITTSCTCTIIGPIQMDNYWSRPGNGRRHLILILGTLA